ncbi:MAG: acyl-CoA thioesterase [Oxalobacter sp.]|nr:MAG: acyl-CoA thioesterase [Oxalobacter sp.]
MKKEKRLVYVANIPIRWGDMDAMGHVNNTVYFRFMEQARIEWYTELGRVREQGVIEAVLASVHCTFFRPLHYPGMVEVRTYAGSPGRSSFEISQEIRRTDDPDTIYAAGGARVVWVDHQTGKSVPIPEEVRALIV